ncbi:MAG TPA: hypothetical protein DCF49_01820 [Lachnospiraceae bacterium]|nr:hypothetical protein [Lachnospiraceae bacterium]
MHVGVHYLTDVIGGAVFGSLCAVVCCVLVGWSRNGGRPSLA